MQEKQGNMREQRVNEYKNKLSIYLTLSNP